MQPLLEIPVSAAGLLLAAVSIVAGAPWFADGLRSLRARRALASVRPESFPEAAHGLCEVSGRVELESPLFSPLSARPCAGYVLEVVGVGTRIGGAVSEARTFRLADGDARAEVHPEPVEWQLAVTAQREVAAGAPIPERIRGLLDRNAELRWLRSQGGALHLVERALCAGAECHVLGELRRERALARQGEVRLARTGTDDAFFAASAEGDPPRLVARVGAGEALERVVVADRAVDVRRLAPPRWRAYGVLLGPGLCLAGLLYLAYAAERLLAGRLG